MPLVLSLSIMIRDGSRHMHFAVSVREYRLGGELDLLEALGAQDECDRSAMTQTNDSKVDVVAGCSKSNPICRQLWP